MARDETPDDNRFNRKETAGTPLGAAVEELALKSGRELDQLEWLTMPQILELAQETYGEALPEFWRIWADWHRPDEQQPMGDL